MYNAKSLLPLARRIKESGRNIWCYTGFSYEQVIQNEDMRALLDYIDVLVDGPYIESRRNTELLFRGSDNQRLIKVKDSLETGNIKYWHREE